ncbi:MAG: TadE/TadG family type IV pilus assembly protein [Pseudomonadota bacterium]
MELKLVLRKLGQFLADERGSAAMEFVVTLPLLMGILVIAYEYGEAFATRESLDSAVRDATRYIARAPAADGLDVDSNQVPEIPTYFVNNAIELISTRTGYPTSEINFNYNIQANQTGSALRSPFFEVLVEVRLIVSLPTLRIFGNWIGSSDSPEGGFTMIASDNARYLGEVPLGDTACSFVRNIHQRSNGEAEC